MNKKIFIVLALASLFIATEAAYTAVVCSNQDGTPNTNCATCPTSANGACTACKTGYWLSTVTATLNNCIVCADTGCATCGSAAAASCTVALPGYLLATGTTGTPGACGIRCATCSVVTDATKCLTCLPGNFWGTPAGTPAVAACTACFDPVGCSVCADGSAAKTCTTPATGYYLDTVTGTPATGQGTATICSGNTAGGATACKVCADTTATAAAAKCSTPNTNYFLLTPVSSQGTATMCNDPNCGVCSDANTCTTCLKGTKDTQTQTVCCGVQNCATCGVAPAGATGVVANANNVCAIPAIGYGLVSSGAATASCSTISAGCGRCDGTTTTAIGICTACKTLGYINTAAAGVTPVVCVASTPSPSTNSPATAAFNVTPTAVFVNTETSTPAFTAVNGYAVYGPGFDDSTAYVWAIVLPTVTTGTVAVNRRTINATFGSSLAKLNGSSDTAISTAIPYNTYSSYAVGPGYVAIASVVTGANWGSPTVAGVATVATASEISVTYIAVNGSSATTKALTGNTNTNVYFGFQNLWIDTGVIYCVYTMATHTAGTAAVAGGAAATLDAFALNGIYIQGVVISTGALLYNTTGGVKSIALTQSIPGTTAGCVNAGSTGCASIFSLNAVSNFAVGGTNRTNSSTVNYVWQDNSGTTNVIKTGTITLATGAGTAGTILGTDVAAAVGTASASNILTMTTYTVGGTLGSYATSGVFVNKRVGTNSGSGYTYVYTVQAYINGSSTAVGNVTVASGYKTPIIQGYGTSDGFVLVEYQPSQTTTTATMALVQTERFFSNGSTNGAATSLGTYFDAPQYYQDTNGSIYVGYTIVNVLTSNPSATYAGYLGKYLAQSLASGASTLTSIFAFLSLMIVALFAF